MNRMTNECRGAHGFVTMRSLAFMLIAVLFWFAFYWGARTLWPDLSAPWAVLIAVGGLLCLIVAAVMIAEARERKDEP